MDIVSRVEKFGVYFFKPVTAKELLDAGIPSDVVEELKFPEDKSLYVVGSVANEIFKRQYGERKPVGFNAIDDYMVTGEAVPVTMLWGHADGYGTPCNTAVAVKRDGVGLMKCMLSIPNLYLHRKLATKKYVEDQLAQWQASLGEAAPADEASSDSAPADEAPSDSAPTEEVSAGAPEESAELSRKDILGILQGMREELASAPVNSEFSREVMALDSAIDVYRHYMEQGSSGKYVRMADGTRKWFPQEKASELLAKKVQERT